MNLTYKELQAALRTAKENGLTSIKLNSKQEVLQAAYDLIYNKPAAVLKEVLVGQCTELTCDITSTSQHLITSAYTPEPVEAKLNNNYPFCSNTVTVRNNNTTHVLPAMNSSRAPSWLCKPQKMYVIDGVDYLPFELDQQLTGAVCDLPAAVNERKSNARPATPIVNSAKDKPKAKLTYSKEPASLYFIDTNHSRFTRTLGTTEAQAIKNVEDVVRGARRVLGAVKNIAIGFHARQVERALKGAA